MRVKHIVNKVRFLLNSTKRYILCRIDKRCPFCDCRETSEVMSKFFFIKLFRCNNCGLMFRWPRDKINNKAYYEFYYDEPTVSVLPSRRELEKLKFSDFKNSVYDISDKIALIKKYVREGMVLDYGASWGYCLWQFLKEGFFGLGYEITKNRADFGQKNLGVKIIYDSEELNSFRLVFDVIFANHVLEHIAEIRRIFDCFYRLLKMGGYLLICVPDCSDIEKEKWKKRYAFGESHCLAFDRHFFYKNLLILGFHIIEIEESNLELMVIAEKVKR